MTFGAINKAAFGWLTGASKAAVNGTLLGANAVALTVTGTSMQLGSDGVTPGNNAINGALQGVQGWPRQLSDAELQQVTL
jgi:S-adenosylmethionine synthetase